MLDMSLDRENPKVIDQIN